jgi:hypothetical protein
MAQIDTEIENVLYFNSIRNYTLAVLDAFNNVKHWVKNEDGTHKEEVIPFTFGNYEKSIALEDIDKETYLSGNFNFIPRMVLTFQGMSKIPERTTNKFQKISKIIDNPENPGRKELQFGYNSVPYDFQYNLIIQARGLNQAFQIIEQIMPRFRPTYSISIQEYPLFDNMTLTQLEADDPDFEILDEFEETDINIITVTIPLNLRANLYMPLQVSGPIEIVKLFNRLWDDKDYRDSSLASYYKFYIDTETGTVENCEDWHYAPPK